MKNQLTQMLGLPSGVTAFQVVCGDDMTVVIGTDGHCYATGSNSHGQLGTGNNLHKNQLTQMLGLPSGVTALQAVCSSWHTVVIGTDGHCYATGSNSHGQLGTGNNPHKNQLTQMLGLPVSDEVKTLASMAATFILSLGLKKVMQKIIESHYNPRVIDLLTEQLPAHLLYCNRCCQIKPSFSQKVIMKRKGTRAGIVRVFASETEYCLGCAIWK
jgi:alpha-tubulin suppressor-like RCC1 family protein